MFTGIVRELGSVAAFDGSRLVVEAPETEAALGDSIAIDGVCLTVVEHDGGRFAFDVVAETLGRTTLGGLAPGDRVNVEPALRAGEPLGGHIVQGHVDGVGTVRSVEPEGDGKRIWFDLPEPLLRYAVEKGSVAIQGTSLTIAAVDDAGVAVALIPHTLEETTLGALAAGAKVNVESDVLAKYVERLLPR